MSKTYHGSCHCKNIQYEADVDFSSSTSRCNCSLCTKLRWWGMMIKPSAFRLLSPKSMDDASITDYQVSGLDVHSLFCSKCGTHAFHKGNIEQIGGPFVS